MRILLADDHAMFRSGLRSILERRFSNAFIQEACSCHEVLALVREESWTIAILDIAMGAENTLSILPEVKQLRPNLPVLILSMYGEKQFVIEALRAGAAGYITKEHTTDELVRGIESTLSGRRFITESVASNLADYFSLEQSVSPHDSLSARELEVLRFIAAGHSVSEIAGMLSLSVKTVSTYRSRILEKMNLRSNADLIRYALQNNLVQ